MERNYVMLKDKSGYHHRSHNKTKLFVHIIFVTKYRKKILIDAFGTDVKQLIFESAKRHRWYIDKMETDKDHIHILIQYPPAVSVKRIVSTLKQESTYHIWKMYPHYLQNQYWKEHTLWSDGYFTASVGDASTETIQRYIEQQG